MKRNLLLLTAAAALFAAPPPTPAERAIAQAQSAVAANPNFAEAHARLAMALARRARETADPSRYAQAGEAIRRAFLLDPSNLAAARAEVWILLGRHEFRQALEKAEALNRRTPDDPAVYGFLTDAHLELGNFAAAERACQKMLDLSPGSPPALTRTAYLRELFGDLEGAAIAMRMAFDVTSPAETEDRAWILTQAAHLEMQRGRLEEAAGIAEQALALFPGYHYALGQLSEIRQAQGRFKEAIALERERYAAAPHAENLYALGAALAAGRQRGEAAKVFSQFEAAARAEASGSDNANHELTAYYLDHAKKPRKALAVAQLEADRRRDAGTLRLYVRALRANGRNEEAQREIAGALAAGIRDPGLVRMANAPKPGGR